ncbi:hypothetical protein [Aestuariispira ectoiniformans]|uniref:hypothetical protein n=1 Tax=Aestuariispira ectoiniformans TaxID=2775080 RepID=UPI00223C29DB|nr:hypothetical protein [Aestuariispira ectoiniformans]
MMTVQTAEEHDLLIKQSLMRARRARSRMYHKAAVSIWRSLSEKIGHLREGKHAGDVRTAC